MKKVILVCMILVGSILLGNEDIDFGEVTVTAERFETTTRNVPKNISIITENEIQKSGASNLMEVLETVPGVVIGDWTGSGKTGSIDLRGQGEPSKNNVLILVDGVSVNSIDMSGPEFSAIPIEEIARVEVLPGSGGVMYGDKAVAGVINIITKDIKKEGISGFIKSEAGSYGLFDYGGKISYRNKKFETSIDYYDKSTDGYRDNSMFLAEDYSIDLDYNISENSKLGFSYSNHNDEYQTPGSLTEEQLEENRKQVGFKNEGTTNIENYKTYYKGTYKNLNLQNNMNYVKTENNLFSKIENEKIVNNLKLKAYMKDLTIITGLDYLDGNSKKGSNDMTKKNIAVFILNKYKLTKELELQGGYRKEFTKLDYNSGTHKKDYDQNLFEVGANYLYSKTGNIYFSLGNTYRTPVIDEYFEAEHQKWDSITSSYKTVPDHYNENLEPQIAMNYELGIKDYFMNSAVDINLFQSKTKNEIYYNEVHNDNMEAETLRRGAEIKLEHYINSKITLKENYTYMEAELDGKVNDGAEVPGVPRHKYSAIIELNPMENFSLSGVFNFVGKRYAISDIDNSLDKISSYKTLDVKGNYKMANINIYGGIKNLLDEKYSSYVIDYGTYNFYPSPERNFYLGIRYNFK